MSSQICHRHIQRNFCDARSNFKPTWNTAYDHIWDVENYNRNLFEWKSRKLLYVNVICASITNVQTLGTKENNTDTILCCWSMKQIGEIGRQQAISPQPIYSVGFITTIIHHWIQSKYRRNGTSRYLMYLSNLFRDLSAVDICALSDDVSYLTLNWSSNTGEWEQTNASPDDILICLRVLFLHILSTLSTFLSMALAFELSTESCFFLFTGRIRSHNTLNHNHIENIFFLKWWRILKHNLD